MGNSTSKSKDTSTSSNHGSFTTSAKYKSKNDSNVSSKVNIRNSTSISSTRKKSSSTSASNTTRNITNDRVSNQYKKNPNFKDKTFETNEKPPILSHSRSGSNSIDYSNEAFHKGTHNSNPINNIHRLHRKSNSTHEVISNIVNHSTNNIPDIKISDLSDPTQNDMNNNNNNNKNKILSTNRSDLMNRRSSFNTTVDLPPSMVQMEPKSPILKNNEHSLCSHSFHSSENIISQTDISTNMASDTSLQHHHHHHHRHLSHTFKDSNQNLRKHVLSYDPTQSPPPSKSGSTNHTESGNSNGNVTEMPSHSNHSKLDSFTSSHLNKITSYGSNTTTAYSTPLNSPGLKRLLEHHKKNGLESEDYFGNINNYNNNNSSEYVSSGETPTMTNHDYSPIHKQTNFISNNYDNIESTLKDTYPLMIDTNDIGRDTLNDPHAQNDISNTYDESNISNDKSNIVNKKKNIKPLDIDATIQKLLDAGYAAKRTKNVCLKNSEIIQICNLSRDIFLSQPSLLELSPPVKIVGDVHGQFSDLLRLFTKCGFPPSSNYLFLGDYVDRGKQSLETILLLLCYKIKYPENFFLLRGNHECANVTRVYGFYDECKRRCSIKLWKIFIDTFNTLPLAAIVAGKIFCVHGGLSPVLNSMDEIRHVSRPTDVPDFGLINDLLWSDPTDSPNEWEDNERGVSYCYNKVAINKFLNKFGFDLVCRAHMVVEDGYEFFNDRSLVTVFSAPNYCGEFDNWGAVMTVSEGLLCSFELLDPLDKAALKLVMKKGRQERKLANEQRNQLHSMENS